jgi:hypothetical protein
MRKKKLVRKVRAGHTHRAAFGNLSLMERRHLESKVKTDGVKVKHQPDRSYCFCHALNPPPNFCSFIVIMML